MIFSQGGNKIIIEFEKEDSFEEQNLVRNQCNFIFNLVKILKRKKE